MRIIIILFVIVLVASTFKTSGASPMQREVNMGQAMIAPATPWDNIHPSEKAITAGSAADPQSILFDRSTKRPSKKKWYPKRWIFRPPMEPN